MKGGRGGGEGGEGGGRERRVSLFVISFCLFAA